MPGSPAPARRKRRILGLDEQQRQAERRRLVLGAALELFGTRGYGTTSIELLCQTAGVGTNSFYDLFANKEAVIVALYDQLTATMRDAVTEEFVAHHDDPDPVRPLVNRFVHAAVDDPRVARVAFIEAAGISPAVEDHRRRTRNDFVEGLQAIGQAIRHANHHPRYADPSAHTPSPRRTAVAIVGAIIETTLDWLRDPDPDPIDQRIDDITYHCHQLLRTIIPN